MITLVITADISANIVYPITYIKKLASNAAKATIKYIANASAVTFSGLFSNVSNILAIIIVATGSANSNNNRFPICMYLLFFLFYT